VRRPHNLPHPLTSFIGREHEIAEVGRLLTATRLLSLTGPGGIGKTRLGHEVAAGLHDAFQDGAWLVELAALTDDRLVPQAVAAVMRVHEEPDHSLTATLADVLRDRQLLVVLDNCEHLVEACAELADALLRACPELRILATSRQPLGIAGETTFRVPSLSLTPPRDVRSPVASNQEAAHLTVDDPPPAPDGTEPAAATSEAVSLFVERARAVVSGFRLTDRNVAAVEQICQRLDGIPLAIELAAARVAVLGPEQIAARLGDRFGFLTGGSRTAPRRHQTLRALVDWSHDLLDEQERALLRRLAVFAGGWTLEAAEAVCSGDGLAPDEILDLLSGLIAKSLVLTGDQTHEVRYRLLESIREYAAEKLRDAGEEAGLRQRHFDWFLALAERAETELAGPQQLARLRQLDAERDNLRAALAWSVERVGAEGGERGVRLAGSMYRYWAIRGFCLEGSRWLAELLPRSESASCSATAARARVRALCAAGRLAITECDYGAAHLVLTESFAIARDHEDRLGLATAAYGLGYLNRVSGNYPAARGYFGEAIRLFRALDDVAGVAETLVALGVVAYFQGDWTAASSLYEEGLAAFQALGHRQGVARSLNNLGEVALEQGDLATARRLEEESLTLASEIGDPKRVAFALAALGGVAAARGDAERAFRLGAAATSIREGLGEPFSDAWRDRFEHWLEPARQKLSEAAVAAAWADGRAMPMEQATSYALTTEPAPGHGVEARPARGEGTFPLSPREVEVAQLIARGLTNRQIAEALVVTEGAAANYVHRVLTKLGFTTRAQVAAWAVEHELGPSPRRP
jgi:predicted ATPase/DNA-binding CsgD family transcriptional regulator